jgi:ectoine hydroxylase-related dioxygenase (phytanoyl-CoA dioxygenase family)
MRLRDNIEELNIDGFCILRGQFPSTLVDACREAFWPTLLRHIAMQSPNRGPHRHFLPMPFGPPCFAPEFFFDSAILALAAETLGPRFVADQWGCDAPVLGSEHQQPHADYARALFEESPGLPLPAYMLVVSFGLTPITAADGPIEIAPGTHRLPRDAALEAVASGAIPLQPILLDAGDVLVRHPWALHRGTPNASATPRALASIRYVRRWYADTSREVNPIPAAVWQSLTPAQQSLLRFPLAD